MNLEAIIPSVAPIAVLNISTKHAYVGTTEQVEANMPLITVKMFFESTFVDLEIPVDLLTQLDGELREEHAAA